VALAFEVRTLLGSAEISLHTPQLQLKVAKSQCLLRHFPPFIGQLDDFHYRRSKGIVIRVKAGQRIPLMG
jgi:hypothetical protein